MGHSLANLVFWQAEGQLVVDLRSRGIIYTRLVDDITCSAIRDLSHADVDWVITKIRAMKDSQGFKLKPGKETIADAGSRMVTTKLVVNVKVSLPSQQRSKTRAAVSAFAALPATIGLIAETKAFNRISGQLAYLTQYHPAEGKGLRAKLKASRAQG